MDKAIRMWYNALAWRLRNQTGSYMSEPKTDNFFLGENRVPERFRCKLAAKVERTPNLPLLSAQNGPTGRSRHPRKVSIFESTLSNLL